jgi:hypothetical protein
LTELKLTPGGKPQGFSRKPRSNRNLSISPITDNPPQRKEKVYFT